MKFYLFLMRVVGTKNKWVLSFKMSVVYTVVNILK